MGMSGSGSSNATSDKKKKDRTVDYSGGREFLGESPQGSAGARNTGGLSLRGKNGRSIPGLGSMDISGLSLKTPGLRDTMAGWDTFSGHGNDRGQSPTQGPGQGLGSGSPAEQLLLLNKGGSIGVNEDTSTQELASGLGKTLAPTSGNLAKMGQVLGKRLQLGQADDSFLQDPTVNVTPTGEVSFSGNRNFGGMFRDWAGKNLLGADMSRKIGLDDANQLAERGLLDEALRATGAGNMFGDLSPDYVGQGLAGVDAVTSALMATTPQGIASFLNTMSNAASEYSDLSALAGERGTGGGDVSFPMLANGETARTNTSLMPLGGRGQNNDRQSIQPPPEPTLAFNEEDKKAKKKVSTAYRSPYEIAMDILGKGGARTYRKGLRS